MGVNSSKDSIVKCCVLRVKISYPLRLKKMEFRLKEMLYWNEKIIKTKNDPFKQIVLKFDRYSLNMSVQENTNYEQIRTYLKKRFAKKEIR